VLIAAAYRTPSIDFEATLYVGQANQSPLWVSEEWCLYRGTDAEVSTYTDTDGWLVLRPIDEGNRAGLPLDSWAGTITYTRNYTWVAA
jgi:hypothetical protein